jgi:two-component sensor histidine kinase/PAS domain-containing protein
MSVAAVSASGRRLRDVALGMPITADLSRSDLLLLRPLSAHQVKVVAQARPRSISPLHGEDLVGATWTEREAPHVFKALRRRRSRGSHTDIQSGAPVVEDVRPVFGEAGDLAGVLSIRTSLIQLERHRHRHPSFRRAIEWLKDMCALGELAGAARLSPFEEMDGILLIDSALRITYLSGIAANLYRRLGYVEDLRGQHLNYLHTGDDVLAITAMQTRQAIEQDSKFGEFEWVRKAVPIWAPQTLKGMIHRFALGNAPGDVGGVLILIHDATEERRKRAELEVKSTMIQEVHHRVKNNLQNVAAVLRMQQRRAQDMETKQALTEAISRILSVAVIHEFLSLDESQSINVRDVCQRIVTQTRQLMTPGQQVEFVLEGPAIYLPSAQATATALVINELVQNALEHGYEHRQQGQIKVVLTDGGDSVKLEVCDDGEPLSTDFDLANSTSLGLQIVRSLVQADLRGEIRLGNDAERGVVATVIFPKGVISAGGAVSTAARRS